MFKITHSVEMDNKKFHKLKGFVIILNRNTNINN